MNSASPYPRPIDFGWGEALVSGTYTFLAIGVATVPADLQEPAEEPVDLRKTIDRIAQVSQENGSVVFASNLPRCQIVLAYASAWHAIQTIHDYYSDPSADLISVGLCVGATFDGDDPTTCVPLLKAQSLSDLALAGQVLLSASTFEVLRDGAPTEWEFEDLGTIHLDFQMRRERIIQLLHPLLPSIRAFLSTEERIRPSLPHRYGLLIGRDGLIDDVIGRLTRFPIITLTGPAGIGKSHLASKVAYELQSADEDVVWVNLTGIDQEAKFYEQVALALGLRGQNFPLKSLIIRQLSGRSVRFVLDGCEKCQGIAKEFVSEATKTNSGPSFLITSPKRLGLDSEEHVLVGLLPNPPIDVLWSSDDLEDHPATALFMDRAREAKPDFQANSTEAQAVSRICNHFRGHPLSILLAAKKVALLSPSQIIFELTAIRGRAGRKASSASKGTRHNSLHLAFEWTYSTLSEEAQNLAKALVPMKGRWQKGMAAALAQTREEKVREPLAELVDVGFVEVDSEVSYGDFYRLPSSVADFLVAKFESEDDRVEAYERHCIIHLQLLAQVAKDLGDLNEINALDKFEEHKQDVLASLEFTLRTGNEISTLADALIQSWRYWYMRNHIFECLQLVDLACKKYKGPITLDLGRILNFGGALAIKGGLANKAERYLLRAKQIAKVVKNERFFCVVHSNFGSLYWSIGQFEKSVLHFEKSEQHLNQDADLSNRANLYTSLFTSLLDAGQVEQSRYALNKAIEIFGDAKEHQLTWMLLSGNGQLHLRIGEISEAMKYFEKALSVAYKTGDKASFARSIYWVAECHFCMGDVGKAAQLLGALHATVTENSVALYPINELRINQLWQKCRMKLSALDFKNLLMVGALITSKNLVSDMATSNVA